MRDMKSTMTSINKKDAPLHMILQHLMHISKYQAVRHLEEFDLKPGQAGILFTLSCNGTLSQRELAQKIGVTPPSMTVALRKMEELGYVRKEPDANDQRVIRILLTQKGENCVGKIKAVIGRMEALMCQGMSKEEELLLRRLLLQMQENLLNSRDMRGVDIDALMKQAHPPMRDEL